MVTRNNVVISFLYLNVNGLTCDISNLFYCPVFPNIYIQNDTELFKSSNNISIINSNNILISPSWAKGTYVLSVLLQFITAQSPKQAKSYARATLDKQSCVITPTFVYHD